MNVSPVVLRYSILFLLLCFGQASFAQQGSELLIQANRATLERNYAEAITLYNQFIQINPTDFRGYFNKGTTLYNAAEYDLAISSFTKTLELNPIYKEAYYYRGMCHLRKNNHAAAIQDYTYILSEDSMSIPFLKQRAEAYAASDQLSLALADLDKAVAIVKLSGDLYKRRAELKVKMKDIDGALRDYNSVEKLIPTYKMVHYIKGNLYLEIEEYEFACDEFKQALTHDIVVADTPYKNHCQSAEISD